MKKVIRTSQILICIIVITLASCQPAATPTFTPVQETKAEAPSIPQEAPQEALPEEEMMPTFRVIGSGPSVDEAQRIGEVLGIPTELRQENGALLYVDGDRYLSLPGEPMGEGEPDEDGFPTSLETLDLQALEAMAVLPDDAALSRTQDALQAANLSSFGSDGLVSGSPRVEHARVEIADLEGNPTLSKSINSEVIYDFALNDRPLVGPGAKLKVSYDGQGVATFLHFALRKLEQGEMVEVYPEGQAPSICLEMYQGGTDWEVVSQLVYFAPEPDMDTVGVIYPHFQCIAKVPIQIEDGHVELMEMPIIYVPAVVDRPQATMSISVEGEEIIARAEVSGGTPPYRYAWSSSSTNLASEMIEGGPEVRYHLSPEVPIEMEHIGLKVEDQNGLWDYFKEGIQVTVNPVLAYIPEGQVMVGIEWGSMVYQPGRPFIYSPSVRAKAVKMLKLTLDNHAVGLSFERGDQNARERDFRDPTINTIQAYNQVKQVATGEDHLYIDNVDLAYGLFFSVMPGWVYFPTNTDYFVLKQDQAKWGNGDLEWLVIEAAASMGMDYINNPKWKPSALWGQAFDGLHLMLGYAGPYYENVNTEWVFAEYLLGNPLSLYKSWIIANQLTQPSKTYYSPGVGNIPVNVAVLGPFSQTASGNLVWHNFNDFFHGKGSGSPDIIKPNISGFITIIVNM